MTTEKYAIVRSNITDIEDPYLKGFPRAYSGGQDDFLEGAELFQEELSFQDAADARSDPRNIAVAAAMPLTLIKPDAPGKPVAAAPATSETWGIRAVGADASGYDGAGIKVAVLDTGIDPAHLAFTGVNLIRKNYTTESADDIHGHGTHCAGTIFGRDVGGLRIGVAPGVTDAIIGKVLGKGGSTTIDLGNAILWSQRKGANIISMSLGIDFPGYVDYLVKKRGMPIPAATSMALEEYRANVDYFAAIAAVVETQSRFANGCLIIAASGNESDRPRYVIAGAPPATATGIISVGAVSEAPPNFEIAKFSNTQCEVCAPGVNVISAAKGGGLVGFSGTSMATPHAAGVMALWAQRQRNQHGSLSNFMMRADLVGNATYTKIVPSPVRADFGAGLVQAP